MRYNFCPNCGFKLVDGFKYCPMCGKPISDLPDYETSGAPIYMDRQPVNTLEKGRELFKDKQYRAALPYLIENATENDLETLYMIGYSYYMLDAEDPQGIKYLHASADQGYSLAQAVLGEYYYRLAERFNIKDMEKGYDPSMGISKEKYDEAIELCPKYYNLALKYLSLAKENKN